MVSLNNFFFVFLLLFPTPMITTVTAALLFALLDHLNEVYANLISRPLLNRDIQLMAMRKGTAKV